MNDFLEYMLDMQNAVIPGVIFLPIAMIVVVIDLMQAYKLRTGLEHEHRLVQEATSVVEKGFTMLRSVRISFYTCFMIIALDPFRRLVVRYSDMVIHEYGRESIVFSFKWNKKKKFRIWFEMQDIEEIDFSKDCGWIFKDKYNCIALVRARLL